MLSLYYDTLFYTVFFSQNDSSDDSNYHYDLFALGNDVNDIDIVIPPTTDAVPSQYNQYHRDASEPY